MKGTYIRVKGTITITGNAGEEPKTIIIITVIIIIIKMKMQK